MVMLISITYITYGMTNHTAFTTAVGFLDKEEKTSLEQALKSSSPFRIENKDFKRMQKLAQGFSIIAFDSGWDLTPQQQQNAIKGNRDEQAKLNDVAIKREQNAKKIEISFKGTCYSLSTTLALSLIKQTTF